MTGAWYHQWSRYIDNEESLFFEWIAPATLEDFQDKEVLEVGCGGGAHTRLVSSVCRSIVAIDLETANLARERLKDRPNVRFVEADILRYSDATQYDVVFSVGVLHHTDDPDLAFRKCWERCRPGGLLIAWVYSWEGNCIARNVVEPARKYFFSKLPRPLLSLAAQLLTIFLYMIVWTVYLTPIAKILPYNDYFANFRRLAFHRNVLNVYDKLNAPQVQFISKERIDRWLKDCPLNMATRSIRLNNQVGWSIVGIKSDVFANSE